MTPAEEADLIERVAPLLGGNGQGACRVIGTRKRLGKTIVEFDVSSHEANGDGAKSASRYIGKVYRRDSGQRNFEALSTLWGAGFRLPSRFTVVRPVAYLSDRPLLLQEKAPGRLIADLLVGGDHRVACQAGRSAAAWLAALHGAAIEAPSRVEETRTLVARYGRELAECVPEEAVRLQRLADHALDGLDRHPSTLRPSHGDFQSENVFLDQSGRVTAIDLDTFGHHESAFDVGYFLVQAALLGERRLGSVDATAHARRQFLHAYLAAAPPCPLERIAFYVGFALLQALYYEICIVKGNARLVLDNWLARAEHALLRKRLDIWAELGLVEADHDTVGAFGGRVSDDEGG